MKLQDIPICILARRIDRNLATERLRTVIPHRWQTYRLFKELSETKRMDHKNGTKDILRYFFLLRWAHLAANGRSAEHAFFSRLIQPREADQRQRIDVPLLATARKWSFTGWLATADKFSYENSSSAERGTSHHSQFIGSSADRWPCYHIHPMFRSSLAVFDTIKKVSLEDDKRFTFETIKKYET